MRFLSTPILYLFFAPQIVVLDNLFANIFLPSFANFVFNFFAFDVASFVAKNNPKIFCALLFFYALLFA